MLAESPKWGKTIGTTRSISESCLPSLLDKHNLLLSSVVIVANIAAQVKKAEMLIYKRPGQMYGYL
jgi:hypothetical protein